MSVCCSMWLFSLLWWKSQREEYRIRGYRNERIEVHLRGLLIQFPQQACEHASGLHHILLIHSWGWRWCIIPNWQTALMFIFSKARKKCIAHPHSQTAVIAVFFSFFSFFWGGGSIQNCSPLGWPRMFGCLLYLFKLGAKEFILKTAFTSVWHYFEVDRRDAAFGPPKKVKPNIHESLREDKGGGLAESQERGEIMCQSEISDMRLSSLTRHVLERPWLSADSKGRDGKNRQQRWRVEKARQRRPPSFNHAGQLSTFWVKEILRVVFAFGKSQTNEG